MILTNSNVNPAVFLSDTQSKLIAIKSEEVCLGSWWKVASNKQRTHTRVGVRGVRASVLNFLQKDKYIYKYRHDIYRVNIPESD